MKYHIAGDIHKWVCTVLCTFARWITAPISWQPYTFTTAPGWCDPDEEVKIICSLSKLLELAGDRCRFCSHHCSSILHRVVGCTIVIKCQCETGHTFVWASSPTICNAEMFKNNLVFTASILLSGNNFYKIQQLCKFSNISCISPTIYFLYQRLSVCPTVKQFYEQSQIQLCSVVDQNVFF